jgi:hypothetical protein
MSHLDVALARLRAGLCVLPARTDSKRPALRGWKAYQERRPTEDEVRTWFGEDGPMCIVTGEVSGQLEMIDFDAGGECFERWSELVRSEIPETFTRLVIERTPSGGRHVVYRSESTISGSFGLAKRRVAVPNASPVVLYGKTYVPRKVGDVFEVILTLIETRGEGGLFLCDPSPGYELVQGEFQSVPTISEADRETLLRAAWSLDELPPMALPDLPPGDPFGRPGDDFNDRGDVREILERHGWVCVHGGENEYWRRPGKGNGWSATLKAGVFYVFSANAAPFEPNRGYSKFAVLAQLEHGGDFRAAATALRTQGFGQQVVPDPGVDLSKITKPTATRPHVIARRVCDVEREQLAWLWPGRIPLGKLTLLAGDPGLGKSLVTLDIAARVSRGKSWPDCPLFPQPVGEVVLFNAEDDLGDTITHRLDKAQADDTKIIAIEGIHIGEKQAKLYFSLEHHLPQLEQALLDWPDVRLIVIDPISAYCGQTDSHNNAEVRALLAPLADLAGRTKAAILAVTHLSKSGGPKAVYRAMGSLAFAAASRAVWAITKDPNEPARRLFLPAKLNLAVDPYGLAYRIVDGRVVWEPEPVKMHADDAMRAELEGPQKPERTTERDEAAEWLKEYLAAGTKPAKEVIDDAKENGISERTLRRAFKELGLRSRKDKEQNCWCWSLPEHVGHEDGHVPGAQKAGQVGNGGQVGNLAE